MHNSLVAPDIFIQRKQASCGNHHHHQNHWVSTQGPPGSFLLQMEGDPLQSPYMFIDSKTKTAGPKDYPTGAWQALLCLNWFSPDWRLLPVHVGCKPTSFAKSGGWSCVFWGADILFSTDRRNVESPFVVWICKGFFRPKILITTDSADVLLMAAILPT